MGAVNFVQRIIGKYAGQAVEVAGNIAAQILEFDGDIFSVQKDTVTVPSRTRVSMPSFAGLIKSFAVTAPIINTGTATEPIVGIDATVEPAVDKVPMRGSSGELYGQWFAPIDTGIPTAGTYRTEQGTVALSTRSGANNLSLIASSVTDGLHTLGDEAQTDENRIAANASGAVVIRFGSTSSLVIEPEGTNGVRMSCNGQTILRMDESGGAPRLGFLGQQPALRGVVVGDWNSGTPTMSELTTVVGTLIDALSTLGCGLIDDQRTNT